MDALISSALEEICKPVHRDDGGGIALSSLCSNLDIGIDLRRSLWINLLKIPSLKFKVRNRDCSPNDSSVQDFDDAEKLGLKILAGEQLRESYLGLYDYHLADSKVSDNQHRILERIATARTSGITNIKLAEELQKDKKNIFYEVKKLEARGLIVKQQAVERNSKGCRDNNLGVNTNILHLYRYAKHLRSQEKFVVTKDETSSKTRRFEDEGFVDGEDNKEDVLIHDFVPEMKAICDKLEETEDKVLAVSTIKRDLGYRGKRFKHRTVNSIFNRLINAGIIEKFDDTMNGKSICYLRLLKKISLEDFGEKSFEANTIKFGRCKTTDQFVELPLQHHIYDMVESAGSEGLLFEQAEKRLGIDKKKNCRARDKLTRLFGLHRETDVVVKAHAHRVWTPGNLNSECLTVGSSQSENLLLGQDSSLKEMKVSCFSIEENMNVSSLESMAMSLIEQPRSKSSEKDSSQTMTIDAIRREQKIIKRLKDEKVVLKSDLYNWLLDTEKDKSTSMDRRTLYRILNKLETEGKCKMIELVVPSIRNSDGSNKTKVVLHPSVQSSSPELLARIGEMERLAAKKNKGRSLPIGKSIDPVLVDGVQRTQNQVVSDSQPDTLSAMCANGFIRGKMIRAKLLHNFLWGYVSSSSDFDDHSLHGDQEHNLKGSAATAFYVFDMKAAIDVIPIASFLQIAGSAKKINNIVEKFMSGLRLSDLPLQEYNNLKDNQAMRRLSSTVSILQRLKLIRLVNSGPSNDGAEVRQITLQYALELCPYIEEPLPPAGSPDGSPRIRHDFFLSNNEAIDTYWEILENYYAAADPRIALLAFPGSTVNEVFRHSSWALVRVTTPDQRAAILKRIAKNNLSKKNPDEECKKIAQDLNLTLEQVLDVFYNRSHDNLNPIPGLASRKRKRNKQLRSIKRRKIDCVRKNHVEQSISDGCGTINDSTRDELFSSWLHGGKEDVTRGGVTLDADLECGHIFHLFGLVSTGVLSVTPNLPVQGVGEAEDIESAKNTYHITDLDYSRRVKGFPGISLCAQQSPVPREEDAEQQLSADGEKDANGNIPHKSCLDKIQGETSMDVVDFTTHRTTIINKSSIMQGTTGLAGIKEMDKICGFSVADVTAKQSAHQRLSEVLGIIMQNPGILEDDIVSKVKLMDPQKCRKLIKKMVEDKILVMRKMYQNVPGRAPMLLRGSLGFEKPEEIYREHFFANPMSSSLL